MLTGYLDIIFYNNTYTTAVCEVCACVGLVAVYHMWWVSIRIRTCNVTCTYVVLSVDVVSRNK